MIVVVLVLILAGSLTGAVVLWLQDASIWMIVLGYVGGGWAGLLLGLPVMLAVRALACPRGAGLRLPLAGRRSSRDADPAWAVPRQTPRKARHRATTPPGR